MRAIRKTAEPLSLTRHRASKNADYDNYHEKDDLRQSLSAEQGAICCYCLQRIRPTQDRMKIEHWHCQTHFSDEQLVYQNLLGACLGARGQPWERQHCDTRKGDSLLSRNPANPAHQIEAFIQFLGDGTIQSSDALLNQELETVLNLNLYWHKANRVAVLDGFILSIRKHKGMFTQELLLRMIADWYGNEGGALRPYCQVVVYWLRKKLARIMP